MDLLTYLLTLDDINASESAERSNWQISCQRCTESPSTAAIRV